MSQTRYIPDSWDIQEKAVSAALSCTETGAMKQIPVRGIFIAYAVLPIVFANALFDLSTVAAGRDETNDSLLLCVSRYGYSCAG